MGFTGPAKVYAKAKGIGLIELGKPLDRDWEGHLRNVHIKLIMGRTHSLASSSVLM